MACSCNNRISTSTLLVCVSQVLVTNLKKEKEELNARILAVENEKVQIHSTVEKLSAKIERLNATHETDIK